MNALPAAIHGESSPVTFRERHRRVLNALADAQVPLSTSELRRRLTVSSSEIRSACVWLHTRHYIGRHLKRVRRPAFDSTACQVTAFWFLTESGEAFRRSHPCASPRR